MKKKINIKEKLRKFREWQQQPCQMPPQSEEKHNCACCQTSYQGNYCPRCGQSSHIRRYSFKTTLLNFMDVWGFGGEGKFRTIRDLILRPGYMIRDYLNGIQAAYFQPFKMFFVLAALSILVTHGLNIKGEKLADDEINETESVQKTSENAPEESVTLLTKDSVAQTLDDTLVQIKDDFLTEMKEDSSKNKHDVTTTASNEQTSVSDHRTQVIHDINDKAFEKIGKFAERFSNIFALLGLLYISGCLYLFFRHCPNIPDLRYSEFFISMVYTANMYSIYSIVLNFFCLTRLAGFALLLVTIPLKQLSGYSWKRTIFYLLISSIIMIGLFILIIIIYGLILMGYAQIAVN